MRAFFLQNCPGGPGVPRACCFLVAAGLDHVCSLLVGFEGDDDLFGYEYPRGGGLAELVSDVFQLMLPDMRRPCLQEVRASVLRFPHACDARATI